MAALVLFEFQICHQGLRYFILCVEQLPLTMLCLFQVKLVKSDLLAPFTKDGFEIF